MKARLEHEEGLDFTLQGGRERGPIVVDSLTSGACSFVMYVLMCVLITRLSSDRQHLSYDVCLEVRGEIMRTVLFCIVY